MSNVPETALWNQCLQGNTQAFEEIYKRFYPLLYAYGIKIVPDHDLIRDTIQNLFVKLIQNHRQLSPTPYIKGYLLCAFRNKLFDQLEQQKSTDDIARYEDRFITDELVSTLFGTDTRESEQQKLMQAFRQLPARQQKILYLYYVSELKHEEIAAVLDINYQSSKNLLFRALTKLRELYFSR